MCVYMSYCIAGNFWGRKLLRIGEKFTEKTFANSHKTTKFMKVFSLKSFPLYCSYSTVPGIYGSKQTEWVWGHSLRMRFAYYSRIVRSESCLAKDTSRHRDPVVSIRIRIFNSLCTDACRLTHANADALTWTNAGACKILQLDSTSKVLYV